VLGVLREPQGKGGSMLMHRAFREGKRVFVTPPTNLFRLEPGSRMTLLLAGGIGVTPLIAMAHELHRRQAPFELHYSAASRAHAGFVEDLRHAAWAERVQFYFKEEGRRADLGRLIPDWQAGIVLYTCGSSRYMDAVFECARSHGFPDEALHRELFAVPEAAEKPREPFTLRLERSGRTIAVGADQSAAEALGAAGLSVDLKCSDGICGVCAAPLISGEVDHRDHVLSATERKTRILLCCSRAATSGGQVTIDV
jgi:ferredoxin-NADP reductase